MEIWSEWKSGTPAAVGWYGASCERNQETRRHWDGQAWSLPVHEAEAGTQPPPPRDPSPLAGMWWRIYSPEFARWLAAELQEPEQGAWKH